MEELQNIIDAQRIEIENLKQQLKKYTQPARNKRYYENNKEKVQQKQKEYYENNKAKISQQQKEYHAKKV